MDLKNILAELKAAQDDFKQSDKAFATSTFCQQTCKILDKVVKGAEKEDFENLVVGIWIIFSSVNDLLPQLIDGPLLTELAEKLFSQCARVVLDIKWQQLEANELCRQNLENALTLSHQYMSPRGFTRFGVVHALTAEPWTDQTLTMVMGSEEDNVEGEGLAYIRAQDPEILKLRVEMMYQENCDEFALNLCTWCLKHPGLAADFTLHKTKFVLLHRLGYIDRLQEECQNMGLVDSIRLVNSLHGKGEHKELCTMLAQTFLVQNWIKPSDSNSKMELLRLWIRLQYHANEDQDNFISSLWAVAKVSRSTEQLLFIIDAVREKCGDTYLQFYLDLCIFAINVDKGCWEKLKESASTGPNEELIARKRDMAQVCDKLAHIVSHVSPKVAFCCALTSFAMMPSEQSLQAVRDAHQRKSCADVTSKSQCCSNCAADRGKCLKNEMGDQASRDVNVATLYEVERLCSMLRPTYLSCDSDLPSLLSLCKQYHMKERGEPVKSALLHRKALVPPQESSCAAPEDRIPEQEVRPTRVQLTSTPVRKTVDASSHVSNVAIPSSTSFTHNVGRIPVEAQTLTHQPDRSMTGANSIIQQLVLKQLPSDTVQTLLYLIQSKQISPVHLSHIMTKNPEKSVEILERLISQFQQGVLKLTCPPQNLQQSSRQNQQREAVHPSPVQQQVEPACQLKQVAVQQHPQSRLGMPAVPQSASVASGGHVIVRQQAVDTQQSQQQTLIPKPPVSTCQTKVATGLMIAQEQESVLHQQPIQLHPQQQIGATPQVQRSHIVRGLRQIRPYLPALSHLRLSGSNEVTVTGPVHIMAFKQSAPLQSLPLGTQSPRLVHSSSQMLTHVSGGSVASLQKTPQIVQLQSTPGSLRSPIPSSLSQVSHDLIPRVPEQGAAAEKVGIADRQISVVSSGDAGNRHYSINNLLFTGEQQNSAMSITLPDTLPEISVDSISDTLRALSGPVCSGSQVTSGEPTKPSDTSTSKVISYMQFPSSEVHTASTPSISRQPRQLVVHKVPISAAQMPMTLEQNVAPVTNMCSIAQAGQNAKPHGQPLPSFSSLFVSNPPALPVLVAEASVGTSTVAVSSPLKTSVGQNFGQKATDNKGIRKNKELMVADNEKMMQLLKQAMTIKICKEDSKPGSGTAAACVHPSSQHLVSTSSNSLGGAKSGPVLNLSPTLARSLLSKSVHPSSVMSDKPASVPRFTSISDVSIPVKATITGVHTEACVSSGAALPTTSFISLQNTQAAVRFPSYVPSGYSNPSQNIVHHPKQTACENTRPTVISNAQKFSMLSAPVAVPSVQFSSQPSGHGAVNDSPGVTPRNSLCSDFGDTVCTTSTVDATVSSLKTYSRTDVSKQQSHRKTTMEPVTSEPIPPSILPEGGGVIERAVNGDQSIATYRCIICAKAFMTLDALRFHVKQVCRPILSQAENLGNRMAANKAQANEAGVETSTVFQCMRCFELCISETGIREHKLVCRPRAKPKPKAKPRELNPEEEQATQAKVMELLNKCLGENREKLQQEAEAVTAKQAGAKKKSPKKRPSLDVETPPVLGTIFIDNMSSAKKPRLEETSFSPGVAQGAVSGSAGIRVTGCVDTPARVIFPNTTGYVNTAAGTSCQNTAGFVNTLASASFPIKVETTYSTASVKSAAGITSLENAMGTSASVAATLGMAKSSTVAALQTYTQCSAAVTMRYTQTTSNTWTNLVYAKGGSNELKPKISCDPKEGLVGVTVDKGLQTDSVDFFDGSVGLTISAAQPVSTIKSENRSVEMSENISSEKSESSSTETFENTSHAEISEKVSGTEASKDINTEMLEDTESESVQEEPTKEVAPPQYKELSGSCGRSFFKCLNCGQTLCSLQSFSEHWTECITKKPLMHESDEKNPKASSFFEPDNDSEMASTAPANKYLEHVKTDEQAGTLTSNSASSVRMQDMLDRDKLSVKRQGENGSAAVDGRLQVKNTPEDHALSASLVKQSVVLLEKIVLPEKSGAEAFKIAGDAEKDIIYTETSELSQMGSSNESSTDSFPATSIKKRVSKKEGGLYRRQQHSRAVVRKRAVKRRRPTNRRYCRICKRLFSQPLFFIQHLASSHLKLFTSHKEGNETSYMCHLCEEKFAVYDRCMAHVTDHTRTLIHKYDKMNSIGKVTLQESGSRISDQEVSADHSKKSGQNSATDSSEDSDTGEVEAHSTDCAVKLTTATTRMKTTSLVNDRRSSGRAAQKQALNKIFISSLGISNFTEPFKESNRRKSSSDEKSIATSRPKRSSFSRSSVEFVDVEDEENSEESCGESDETRTSVQKDPASAAVQFSEISECNSKDAEQTSTVDTSEVRHGSDISPQDGSMPVSSPFLTAPKKPSFMDSFLNFVNNRSPEAPLPLNQTKRRFSYLRTSLESTSPTLTPWRRNSWDELRSLQNKASHHIQQSTSLSSVPSLMSSLQSQSKSDGVTEVHRTSPKSPQASCASKVKTSDYKNVYFYGEFEEQLTQQCKVNLGHRVKAEEVQPKQMGVQQNTSKAALISMKKCIVNLGPKVNPAAYITGSVKSTTGQNGNEQDTEILHLEVETVSEPGVGESSDVDVESDSDTLVASTSAPSPVGDTEDTISLDGIPLSSDRHPTSASDEVCGEVSQPMFLLPPSVDIAVTVDSVVSKVAEESLEASVVQSTASSCPAVETETLSLIGSPENKQVDGDDVQCVIVSRGECEDSSDDTVTTGDIISTSVTACNVTDDDTTTDSNQKENPANSVTPADSATLPEVDRFQLVEDPCVGKDFVEKEDKIEKTGPVEKENMFENTDTVGKEMDIIEVEDSVGVRVSVAKENSEIQVESWDTEAGDMASGKPKMLGEECCAGVTDIECTSQTTQDEQKKDGETDGNEIVIIPCRLEKDEETFKSDEEIVISPKITSQKSPAKQDETRKSSSDNQQLSVSTETVLWAVNIAEDNQQNCLKDSEVAETLTDLALTSIPEESIKKCSDNQAGIVVNQKTEEFDMNSLGVVTQGPCGNQQNQVMDHRPTDRIFKKEDIEGCDVESDKTQDGSCIKKGDISSEDKTIDVFGLQEPQAKTIAAETKDIVERDVAILCDAIPTEEPLPEHNFDLLESKPTDRKESYGAFKNTKDIDQSLCSPVLSSLASECLANCADKPSVTEPLDHHSTTRYSDETSLSDLKAASANSLLHSGQSEESSSTEVSHDNSQVVSTTPATQTAQIMLEELSTTSVDPEIALSENEEGTTEELKETKYDYPHVETSRDGMSKTVQTEQLSFFSSSDCERLEIQLHCKEAAVDSQAEHTETNNEPLTESVILLENQHMAGVGLITEEGLLHEEDAQTLEITSNQDLNDKVLMEKTSFDQSCSSFLTKKSCFNDSTQSVNVNKDMPQNTNFMGQSEVMSEASEAEYDHSMESKRTSSEGELSVEAAVGDMEERQCGGTGVLQMEASQCVPVSLVVLGTATVMDHQLTETFHTNENLISCGREKSGETKTNDENQFMEQEEPQLKKTSEKYRKSLLEGPSALHNDECSSLEVTDSTSSAHLHKEVICELPFQNRGLHGLTEEEQCLDEEKSDDDVIDKAEQGSEDGKKRQVEKTTPVIKEVTHEDFANKEPSSVECSQVYDEGAGQVCTQHDNVCHPDANHENGPESQCFPGSTMKDKEMCAGSGQSASEEDLSSMSMLEFLQKSAFSVIKNSPPPPQALQTDEMSLVTMDSAGEMMPADSNSDCEDWDTCEDKIDTISLSDESLSAAPPLASEATRPVCDTESADIGRCIQSDKTNPSPEGDQVTKTDVDSCKLELLPASTQAKTLSVPPTVGPDSPTPCPNEILKEQDQFSDLLVHSHKCTASLTGRESANLLEEAEMTLNNGCESANQSHVNHLPIGRCRASPESNHQVQSNVTEPVDSLSCHAYKCEDLIANKCHSTVDQSADCHALNHSQQQMDTCLDISHTMKVQDQAQGLSNSHMPVVSSTHCHEAEAGKQPICDVQNEKLDKTQLYQLSYQPACNVQEITDQSVDCQVDQLSSCLQEQEQAMPSVDEKVETLNELEHPDQKQSDIPRQFSLGRSLLVGVGSTTSNSAPLEVSDCVSESSFVSFSAHNSVFSQCEHDGSDNTKTSSVLNKCVTEILVESSSPATNLPSTEGMEDSDCFHAEMAVPLKSADDADPENDLPDLCIIPDPQGTVIKPNTADTCADRKLDDYTSNDEIMQNEIIASVDSCEARIWPLKPLKVASIKMKAQSTYHAVKMEKADRPEEENLRADEDDQEGLMESPFTTRKPLLAMKTLRRMHKPQPFVWEIEGEEDRRKRVRNERSLKAFRSKAHVPPFSWDCDEASQDQSSACGENPAVCQNSRTAAEIRCMRPLQAFRQKVGSTPFSWDFNDEGNKIVKANSEITSSQVTADSNTMPKDRSDLSLNLDTVKSTESIHSQEKCIKVKTLTTSGQGRLLPRLREAIRSGSCDKIMLGVSRQNSSAYARNKLCRKEKPLRKSRSCDIECRGTSSERPLDSVKSGTGEELGTTDKQKIDSVNKNVSSTKLKYSVKSNQQHKRLCDTISTGSTKSAETVTLSTCRKWRCQQQESASGDKTDSETKELERNVYRSQIKRRLDVCRPQIKSQTGTEKRKTRLQQHTDLVTNAKLFQSKATSVNRVELPHGSPVPSRTKSVSRHNSPFSDCTESPRSVMIPSRMCCSRDSSPVTGVKQGGEPNLKDCVRSLRKKLLDIRKAKKGSVFTHPLGGGDKLVKKESLCHKSNMSSAQEIIPCASTGPTTEMTAGNRRPHKELKVNRSIRSKSKNVPLSKTITDSDSVLETDKIDSPAHSMEDSATAKENPLDSNQQPLTAMVRRRKRPANWSSVHQSPKKPCIATSETPQYEIIRVEPVISEASMDLHKTRSIEKELDQGPRTVHTRVAVDDVKPLLQPPAKTGSAQKWQINRHIAPSDKKKKNLDLHYPFTFERARSTAKKK